MPEGAHGEDADAIKLGALIKSHSFDWLGMEALPTAMQPTLDAFVQAPERSEAYKRARAALIDYFTVTIWNRRPGQTTTGEDNYYFKLMNVARSRHVRLVGLEGTTNAFMVFCYSESPFGLTTRNALWARAVPKSGRGAVFGGGAHMYLKKTPDVQDFLYARNPRRRLVSLAPIDWNGPQAFD